MNEEQTQSAEIGEITDELVRKAAGILDPAMKSVYVAEKLAALDVETIAGVLRGLYLGASNKRGQYHEVLDSGINPIRIRNELGRYKFSQLYHHANRNEFPEIVALFSRTRPAKDGGEEDLFLVYGLADQSVGHRRFLAKSNDKLVLDKVGYDQEPLVIQQLLLNPRLTEPEVVKIAARRPNVPDVLAEIYRSKKWLARYPVKLALAANPYCSPQVARTILPFLSTADLRFVAASETLEKGVRAEARRMLEEKKKSQEQD
jgi:hypothetical protein